jgi:hypothetical protein
MNNAFYMNVGPSSRPYEVFVTGRTIAQKVATFLNVCLRSLDLLGQKQHFW